VQTTNGTRALQELSSLEADLPHIAASLRCAPQVPVDKLRLQGGLFDAGASQAPLPPAMLLQPLIVAEEGDNGLKNPAASCRESSIPMERKHTYSRSLTSEQAPGNALAKGFIILDGCKRLLELRERKQSYCACAIVNGPLSGTRAGLLRILLNRGRALDIGEQVLFYKWLKARELAGDASRLLAMQENVIHEIHIVTICADDVVSAVCSGHIHAQNAPDFNLLSEQDRPAFLEFFRGLALSQQTEMEFLQWLPEIASVRGIAARDVLALPECVAAQCDTRLNGPQKIQKIRAFLHSLRYPQFDAALKQWNALSQKINPDFSSIHFVPDRFFEKDRLDIRVTVSKPDQATKIFESLRKVSREEWSHLLRPPGIGGT
jgi:hypothetical protein